MLNSRIISAISVRTSAEFKVARRGCCRYQSEVKHQVNKRKDNLSKLSSFYGVRFIHTSQSRRQPITTNDIIARIASILDSMQEWIKPMEGYPTWKPTEEDILMSNIRVPTMGATKLSNEQLTDKVKGAIFGQALGDAMGLATEFMTKKEAESHYGEIVKKYGFIDFDKFLKDDHRTWWEEGDWTDDTDQMIAILDSVIKNRGNVDVIDFARRLSYWTFNGFTELGDTSGAGLGVTVISVVGDPNFTKAPHEIAQKVFAKSKGRAAANGGVMRTSVLGIPYFHDLSKVKEQTVKVCKVTHADPRCIASSVIVTNIIARMLQGEHDVAAILAQSRDEARRTMIDATNYVEISHKEAQIKEFERYANAKNLEELELDQGTSIGYTFKAMGAALVLFQSDLPFKESLTKLTMQGGDADSNGAVAGAVLGCRVGFQGLPQDLINSLPHKEWLETKVNYLLRLMALQ